MRWSPRASSAPPWSGAAVAAHDEPVVGSSMSAPIAARPSTSPSIRSDSLWRSSSAPADDGLAARRRRRAARPASARRSSSGPRPAPPRCPRAGSHATSSSPTGSSSAWVPGSSRSPRITAPIRWAMRKKPGRVQLRPTFSMTTRDPGTRQAAATMNAADDGSPGTVISSSSSSSTSLTVIVSPSRSNGTRASAQDPLGVVAALGDLGDRRAARRQQAGDQHAGLDLGAGHGQLVVDALQVGAPHDRAAAGARRGPRRPAPIIVQRLDHPVHRPAPDRLVAVERPLAAGLPGQPSGQQPQQRARVAHVEPPAGGLERGVQAHPADHQRAGDALLLHPGAEREQRLEGRARVGRVEVVAHRHRLVAHRGEERRAVGDRLVGRGPEAAP